MLFFWESHYQTGEINLSLLLTAYKSFLCNGGPTPKLAEGIQNEQYVLFQILCLSMTEEKDGNKFHLMIKVNL